MSKTVLITGASSGIGSELALKYSQKDTKLFLTARNVERLEAIGSACRQLGAEVDTKTLDVMDSSAVQKWIEDIEVNNQVDVLIISAGIMETCEPEGRVETLENSLKQIDTNFRSAIVLSNAVIPGMQSRSSGQIVFIASLAGLQPVADVPSYSASKAGIIAYGEALGNYLHNQGIVVTVICPGYVTTPMTAPYNSFRPFEMHPAKVAEKVKRAVDKKRRFVAFPFPLLLLIRLGRFLPTWLRRITNAPFNFT